MMNTSNNAMSLKNSFMVKTFEGSAISFGDFLSLNVDGMTVVGEVVLTNGVSVELSVIIGLSVTVMEVF